MFLEHEHNAPIEEDECEEGYRDGEGVDEAEQVVTTADGLRPDQPSAESRAALQLVHDQLLKP